MVFNRKKALGLGGVVLSAVAVTILVSSALAQGGGFQGGPGGQGGGFPGGQGQPGRGFQFQPMGIGGPSTMIGDERNIYILQGNRLIKVKKSDLSIEAEKQIPMPRPQPGGPGPDNRPPLE